MTQSNDPHVQLARYETYLDSDPRNRNLLADCIDLALACGDADRAGHHVHAALQHYPDDPFFGARHANVLMAQREWEQAATVLAPIFAEFKEFALAFNLASAYSWLGRYDDAWGVFEPFLAQALAEPEAAALAVRIQHHRGQVEEAQQLADRAMDTCGQHPGFLGAASAAYFDGDRAEDAIRCSELALAGGARPIEAVVIAGSLALAAGDAALARERFDDVLARSPQEGRAWSGLGIASLMDGDFVGAAEKMEQAVQRLPRHIGSWHGLAWARLFGGDLEGSAAAFRQTLDLDRNFADSHGGLAALDAMRGRRQEAEAGIERALRLDRTSLAGAYARMILDGETADPAGFKDIAMRLLARQPGLPGMSVADAVRRARPE
jgi:tetratricopeptide (TPR) repeat protein